MTGEGFDWYKRNPQKMIRGVRGMGAAMIGCYNVILDLIYADEDSCPNDPAFIGGILGESARMTRSLISRLVEMGKLDLCQDDRLRNSRAEIELENRAKQSRIARESGAKGGRVAAEKRIAHKKDKGLVQAPLYHLEKNRIEEIQNSEVPSLFSPEVVAAPPPSVVDMPLIGGKIYPILPKLIEEYQLTYPAVNVLQQMREMRQWSLDNPKQQKTKDGVRRFMNSWLSREQNRAGRLPPMQPISSNVPGVKKPYFNSGAIISVIDGGKP